MEDPLRAQSFYICPLVDPSVADLAPPRKTCRMAFEGDGFVIGGQKAEAVYFNDAMRSLGWVAPASEFSEGHVTFSDDSKSFVGTAMTVHGDHVAVTGSVVTLPGDAIDSEDDSEDDAPPAYSLSTKVSYRLAARDVAAAVEAAPAEPASKIRLQLYGTKRRLKSEGNDPPGEFKPYLLVELGTENRDVLSAVFYLDKVDISTEVAVTVVDGVIHFARISANPFQKSTNCTFEIKLTGIGSNRAFSGTLIDQDGEWEWNGEFYSDVLREREEKEVTGSDGRHLQELLSVSNMARQGSDLTDLAQLEADRILQRILISSIPEEARKNFFPDLPALSDAEVEIKNLGPDYCYRSGVHFLLGVLQKSEKVDAALRNRINLVKCESFQSMCMSSVKPDVGNDPVTDYGWSRETNKADLEKLQKQQRDVALGCYKLGYRRTVSAFQPFLANAKEWYGLLATHLTSDEVATSWKIESCYESGNAKFYSYQLKLTLLHDAAKGDVGDAPDVQTVMSKLQSASSVSLLEQVGWDDTTKEHLRKFFANLDQYEKEKRKDGETHYKEMHDLMQEREGHTWSETWKATLDILDVLQKNERWSAIEAQSRLALLLDEAARGPLAKELKDIYGIEFEKLGFWSKSKHILLAHIRGAIAIAAVHGLVKTLFLQDKKLGIAEELSAWGTITEGFIAARNTFVGSLMKNMVSWTAKGVSLVGKLLVAIGSILARGLRWIFMRLLPENAQIIIMRAALWVREGTAAILDQVGGWVFGLSKAAGQKIAENIHKGLKVFGFCVSCLCLWAAVVELDKALREGRSIDHGFAITGVVIAALETVTLVVHGIAWLAGAARICSLCSYLGPAFAIAGLVVAVIALVVTLVLHEDPVKNFIEKYGGELGLLKS